jgi:hypothetical protein
VRVNDPGTWARLCRTQAALTADPKARDLLLELAAEYEALDGRGNASIMDEAGPPEIVESLRVAVERKR